MEQIAGFIAEVLQAPNEKRRQGKVRQSVKAMCKRFPVFYSYEAPPA